MNCQCNTEQRRLTPGVFNLKQYLNGAERMVWRLTSHTTSDGECDLCKYDAFLVLSAGGKIDEVLLTKSMDGDTLQLTWEVGRYATTLTGYVKYQIVFRSAEVGTLGVIGATDTAANGIYTVTTGTAGISRVFQNAAGYKIKWDTENTRWTLYSESGEAVDYQRFPNERPCCGTWNTVAVSNNTAAVWASDEAIMFVSETIAADEAITANFPTILRQVWEAVHSMILESGFTTVEATVTEDSWTAGETGHFWLDADALLGDNVPVGTSVVDARLFEADGAGGYSNISNLKIELSATGEMKIHSIEKTAGKIVLFLRGGGSVQTFFVRSVNGATGDITLTPDNIGAAEETHTHSIDSVEGLRAILDTLVGNSAALNGETIRIEDGSAYSIKEYIDARIQAQFSELDGLLDELNGEEANLLLDSLNGEEI